jgi:hypothetical protein
LYIAITYFETRHQAGLELPETLHKAMFLQKIKFKAASVKIFAITASLNFPEFIKPPVEGDRISWSSSPGYFLQGMLRNIVL